MKTNNQHSNFINFRNYYTGNMSPKDKVAFEKQLEQDPFAQEAYEGFLVLENDPARISAIENTNLALKEKFGINTSTKIFPLKYLATIAASLVLFIGSYFIIQNNVFQNNNELADNHIEKENIPAIIEEEESIAIDIIDTLNNATGVSDSLPGETMAKLDDIAQESEDVVVTEVNEPAKNIEKKEKTNTDKPKAASKQINNDQFDYYRNEKKETNNSTSNTTSVTGVASSPSADKDISRQMTNTMYADDSEVAEEVVISNISDYKKGIVAYNKSEYTKAIIFFNNSINQNISVAGSNYYTAMSYFNQNKSLKAIKYFNKTISLGSSFKDKALWYKSLTLIRRGEKIEAKFILNQIANSNSSYKNAAIEKLNTLK